jgi:hypothetical protein
MAKRAGCLNGIGEWHTVRTLRDAAILLGFDEKPHEMLPMVERHLANDGAPYSREEICAILGCTDAELAKHSLNSNTQNSEGMMLIN